MNEIRNLAGDVFYIPDPCEHESAVPVESTVDGATVSWLCPECDAQMPAEWR